MISNSAGFVLAMDILYFCVCAFSNFCFVMALDGGRVRLLSPSERRSAG